MLHVTRRVNEKTTVERKSSISDDNSVVLPASSLKFNTLPADRCFMPTPCWHSLKSIKKTTVKYKANKRQNWIRELTTYVDLFLDSFMEKFQNRNKLNKTSKVVRNLLLGISFHSNKFFLDQRSLQTA